ncbi:hypothetical protein COO60DRAFT_1639182 [Scenedesmus sp. NREL 46B-D3]|nr:hypothetical protein COO60DRAFT_1639182 [Scenedesmus sp. NREL 46B-D3]
MGGFGNMHILYTCRQRPSSAPEHPARSVMNGGTELQKFCSRAITAAQTFVNVPATGTTGQTLNITEDQVQSYVTTAPPPSEQCCKSACEFNANYCNCEQGVLDFATQLTGGNINIYRSIAKAFQRVCNYKLMLGETCPAQP